MRGGRFQPAGGAGLFRVLGDLVVMEVVLAEGFDEEEQLVRKHRKEKKELQGKGEVGTRNRQPARSGECWASNLHCPRLLPSSLWPLPFGLPCPGGPLVLQSVSGFPFSGPPRPLAPAAPRCWGLRAPPSRRGRTDCSPPSPVSLSQPCPAHLHLALTGAF